MITLRPAAARGAVNFGWLDSRHTFSFGNYYDPDYMGFSVLRVINEDQVLPGQGFDTHGHQDMEIISYVLDGALEHQDSIGNRSVIRPGDVQRMSAGTGIRHSEYNPSDNHSVHFLQIWITPDTQGLTPSYAQIHVAPEQRQGKLRLVGSRQGQDGSMTIHQDVNFYVANLAEGEAVELKLNSGRVAWVQVARGAVDLNRHRLIAGDGAAVTKQATLTLSGVSANAEVLVFDLPA